MEPKEYLRLLHTAEALKNATRHSWTSAGRHESVADHSWRLALMAMLLRDEFPQLDLDKVLRMCVIHDLGEAFTGDIPAFEKTAEHEQTETRLLNEWVRSMPAPYAAEFAALYAEMDALQTPEARLYKALDRMEAVIQHNEADVSTWLPLEYDLQHTYGMKDVQFSEYLKALRAAVTEETDAKIAAAGGPPEMAESGKKQGG